jgi:hypothetical protein
MQKEYICATLSEVMLANLKQFFGSLYTYLKAVSSKKHVFAFSFILLFLYSALIVFAVPPSSPYVVGDNITDPTCAPGSTNCFVTASSGSGVGIGDLVTSGTPSSILYLDNTGNLTQDALFTRDVDRNTNIAKDIQNIINQTTAQVGPILIADDIVGTFQQGETVTGDISGATGVFVYAQQIGGNNSVIVFSSVTGTFQQGEAVTGQTSGATSPYVDDGLFNPDPFSPGDTFEVLDPSLGQIGGGTITGTIAGGYTYTLSFGTIDPGNLLLDDSNGPSKVVGVISLSTNQLTRTSRASAQVGEILPGILFGTEGAGDFYTDIASGVVVGQWVGQDGGGNNNTFNQTAFDITNNRGVYTNGILGDVGASPYWETGVVDVGANWSGGIRIERDATTIEQTNKINLNSNNIAINENTSNGYVLPYARGSAGQVLMDVNGDGNLSWQTPSGGGGGSGSPGGNTGSIQYNTSGSFAGDNNLFWDSVIAKLGIGTNNLGDARVTVRALTANPNQMGQFSGTGLNDATFSGTYTGPALTDDTFAVIIDSTNNPNTFSWSSANGSGSNIPISGGPQYLTDGISITFASTYGHTLGNQWTYHLGYSSTYSVNGANDLTWGGSYTGSNQYDNFTVTIAHEDTQFINYGTLVGTFQQGETVTGGTSGATGTIFTDDGANLLIYDITDLDGFDAGETITGALSGATAVINIVPGFVSDTFSWSSANGSGTDIPIDQSVQTLIDGITIQYGSLVGHQVNDYYILYTTLDEAFSGSGQDDAFYSGTYSGGYSNDTFTVTIDSTSPGGDIFSWSSNNGSGSNIAIDGSQQYLTDGVSIQFNSNNGHTVGNSWQLSISPGSERTAFSVTNTNSSNVFTIDGAGATNFYSPNLTIGNVNYVFPNSQAGGSGYMLTNDGNGTLSWTAPGGGGGSSPITILNTSLISTGLTDTASGVSNLTGSIIFGSYAGVQATNAHYSNFLGGHAGDQATNAQNSNFFGFYAGADATNAADSNFFGLNAGNSATDANYSNFFGSYAGNNATNAANSNFFGESAGNSATNADHSNFFGDEAGIGATDATNSNFIGNLAGSGAVNADHSNFFGYTAGQNATNAAYSNFLGASAGFGATNARNSIFIGESAGANDTANNTGDVNDYSILIGNDTSTAGFENSIALGGYATNTASNQFMIGSTTRPINEVVIKGSGTCSIVATGISCSSDERLKTNIEDLENTTLGIVTNIRTVRYNWNTDPTGNKTLGFLAQDLEQYYPELVRTDADGFKMVNYAQMTPILVEAIREINLKVVDLSDVTKENTWRDALVAWFGNIENGIDTIYAKVFESEKIKTQQLCVGETCLNEQQVQQILQAIGSQSAPTTLDPGPTTDQLTCTAPQVLNQTADACIDPIVVDDIPTETPPTDEPSDEITPTE